MYTKPTHEVFYSKYGFHLPLVYDGVTYAQLAEGKTTTHAGMTMLPASYSYLVARRDGTLWSTWLKYDSENPSSFTEQAVPVHLQSEDDWWVLCDEGVIDSSAEYLIGFLSTNPTKEEIEAIVYEREGSAKLTWLKIADVAREINERFPENKKTADSTTV
jgi:hypothetical protein